MGNINSEIQRRVNLNELNCKRAMLSFIFKATEANELWMLWNHHSFTKRRVHSHSSFLSKREKKRAVAARESGGNAQGSN